MLKLFLFYFKQSLYSDVCYHVFWGTVTSAFELPVISSAMCEGILHVCLARWDTICDICHNGIVYSHQLCSVENAFT